MTCKQSVRTQNLITSSMGGTTVSFSQETAEYFPIETTVELESSFGAILVQNADGEQFIWKPLTYEKSRGDFPPQNGFSEIIAHDLDGLLGFNLVAPTQYGMIEGKVGTVNKFIQDVFTPQDYQFKVFLKKNRSLPKGQKIPSLKELTSLFLDESVIDQLSKMVIFDEIMGNKDRRWRNWLIDLEQHRIWAIDHGSVEWFNNQNENATERGGYLSFRSITHFAIEAGMKAGDYARFVNLLEDKVSTSVDTELLKQFSSITKKQWMSVFSVVGDMGSSADHSWNNLQQFIQNKGITRVY